MADPKQQPTPRGDVARGKPLNDGQIWLLEAARNGFSRVNLLVPYSGHGSSATNHQCAGLIRRGLLEEPNGIVRITVAGTAALLQALTPQVEGGEYD